VIVWKAPVREGADYYGCVRGRGRAHRIASEYEHIGEVARADVGPLAAAGLYVAYGERFEDQYHATEMLVVRDLATHRVSFSIEAGESFAQTPGEPEALKRLGRPVGTEVLALAVDVHGDVAWRGSTEGAAPQQVLYLHDRRGTRRVAAGASIGALAFHGARLTWIAEGAAQSAPA
jgi:hypothetical protein